ncbi:hypothetical protein WAF17_02365 [Bernardetia sp. ABR2-2B]|uniref:hypothetical protein n=1 Tax=Bernardetia sp. ABR2-2B TaxID=3127472 RepID=UPI0030D3F39E
MEGNEKRLSFEQLQELSKINRFDVGFYVEKAIPKETIEHIGITITHKNEIIYQREVKDGIAMVKRVSISEYKVNNNEQR